MKRYLAAITLALLLMTGCSQAPAAEAPQADLSQLEAPKAGDQVAILATSKGEVRIRLMPDAAPKAVENFVGLAEKGYYDGLTFHRVMNDFMIQGGDPSGNGTGGESLWGKPFADEFSPAAHNFRGALSMANSGADTNGSQFFIVQLRPSAMNADMQAFMEKASFPEALQKAYMEQGGTPWLDNKHTVFGQVYEGMDVVDAIAAVETDGNSKPLEPVTIQSVKIETFK